MSTYTQLLFQIVFSPHDRRAVMVKDKRNTLFEYISGILAHKKCKLYKINGVEDHLHILTDIHPTVSLSGLVKDIKVASALYIKEYQLFKGFTKWQEGYSAFTYNISSRDYLIDYIKNQEEHHKRISYLDELKALLDEHQVEYNEKYLK